MRKSVLVKVAVQSILKNKMRSLLTMLGIVIGVGAVIVMVAVGQGAQSRIEQQIQNLGTNMIVITPGSSQQGGVSHGAGTFNRLTLADAEKLKREGGQLSGVTPVIFTRAQAIGGQGNWRTIINGVATDWQTIRDWPLKSGTFFSETDVRSMRKVAVLGSTVANNLFLGADPVGQQVQLRGVPFSVIGVLETKGQTASGTDQDDVIIIPYTTAQSRLSGSPRIWQILAATYSPTDIPTAQQEMKALLRESHRLGADDEDDFTIRNQTELAEAASGTTQVMSYLLAAIASISLLVGGIGIMNIMLVSVTERTREIGIRMAVGARSQHIRMQFLIESVVLGVAGGLAGILLGVGFSFLISRIFEWPQLVSVTSMAASVVFSIAVGAFFGYYPARKAAALDPIEALRYE